MLKKVRVLAYTPREQQKVVEQKNVLFGLVSKHEIDDAEFAKRVELGIIPIWEEASARLSSVTLEPRSPSAKSLEYLRSVVESRMRAYRLCASGARASNEEALADCVAELGRGDQLILQWIASSTERFEARDVGGSRTMGLQLAQPTYDLVLTGMPATT